MRERVMSAAGQVLRSNMFRVLAASLLLLTGVFFGFQFLGSVFTPKYDLAVLVLDLSFSQEDVNVVAYYTEVGRYRDLHPYDLVRASWSECSQGVSYTVYLDGNYSYGPYCLSGLGGAIQSLLQGGVYSHVEVAVPPGTHTLRIAYVRDGSLVKVRTLTFTSPSVRDVSSCGGVYPCRGGSG